MIIIEYFIFLRIKYLSWHMIFIIIIENQINPEIKENKDFKEFFDSNDNDIMVSNNVNDETEKESNKNNKKNINLYHQFKKKNINLYHQFRKNNNNTNMNKNNKNPSIPVDGE